MDSRDKRTAQPAGLLASAVLLLLLSATPALADQPTPDEGEAVPTTRPCRPAVKGELFRVDFDGVELGILARLVSCAAELDLMFTPQALASRKVSVISTRPVPIKDLVALFVHALHRNGLVLERRGRYGVIRAAAGGTTQPSPKRRSNKGR